MSIFDDINEMKLVTHNFDPNHPGPTKELKHHLPVANCADFIKNYIDSVWPEFIDLVWGRPGQEINTISRFPSIKLHGLWLTGSRIWRIAYNFPIDESADWDMFVNNSDEMDRLLTFLRTMEVPIKDDLKKVTSLGGTIVYTSRGRVDCWLTNYGPFEAIRNYPPTHGHCRVAYNPQTGSVIMSPSRVTEKQDIADTHEMLAISHAEAASKLKKELSEDKT